MDKISYSPYLLKGKSGFGNREGALLRFTFANGLIGYADCCPFTPRGDHPLKEQLNLLSKAVYTPLTKRSLEYAQLDAEARQENRSLFEGLKIPKSHRLIGDETIPSGFDILKIKNVETFLKLVPKASSSLKFRLDFNFKGGFKELEAVQPWKERIDCIEDPFPFDQRQWLEAEKKYGIPFALDHGSEFQSYRLVVMKPAVQNVYQGEKVIVTSYLDHPLGQLSAAYSAAKLDVFGTGLITHLNYVNTPWSESLTILNQSLVPPEGTGFGFNELLEKEFWKTL